MDDTEILGRIHNLVEEEKELRSTHAGKGLHGEDRARLSTIEEHLDQAWDLLRRRRAQAEIGADEDGAGDERDVQQVERYLQ
ncbi:MAG: hypothetical protein JWM76_898 [Pseudonocardiales bacterium]|nr:hypothetical protein [Pseudonocardiales bacterium]